MADLARRFKAWLRGPSEAEMCAVGRHEWPMWVPASTLTVHCMRPGCRAEQRTRGRYVA